MLASSGPVRSPPSPHQILYGQHSLLTHIYPLQYIIVLILSPIQLFLSDGFSLSGQNHDGGCDIDSNHGVRMPRACESL